MLNKLICILAFTGTTLFADTQFDNILNIISKKRLEVIFDPVNNNVGVFNSTGERKYLVFAIQALVENLASDTNMSFDSAIDEIKIIHSTMEQ